MTLPPVRHEQFATLRGSTGECIPDCQGCEIERLRAELAEAEQAHQSLAADHYFARAEKGEAALAVAVDALERIEAQWFPDRVNAPARPPNLIAREALDRIRGQK